MGRVAMLFRTTIGKKIIMAVSGGALVLFLLGHMAGNLKVFLGADAFNAYAEGLRELGEPFLPRTGFLWVARVGLLAMVWLHIWSAVQLVRTGYAARPIGYKKVVHLEDTYASRTMRWGGVIIFAFIVYHLMHLTFGNVHPSFQSTDPYSNLVSGFQVIPVAIAYIAAMVMLGFHLSHGIWSAFQTLGLNHPEYNKTRRIVAVGLTATIILGFIAVPSAVMLGIVQ